MNNKKQFNEELIPKTSFKPIAAPKNIFGAGIDDVHYLKNNMRFVYEDLMKIFVASKTPITLWGSLVSDKIRSIEAMNKLTDENGIPYQVITTQLSTQSVNMIHSNISIKEYTERETDIIESIISSIEQEVWDYYNNKGGLTIIFLEDITTYTPVQQNAILKLITHGKYGDIDILPYTTFVMSATFPDMEQDIQEISESLIRRSGHIPFVSKTRGYEEKGLTTYKDQVDSFNHINQIELSERVISERVITELSKVYETISEIFKDSPYEIYELYIKEALRAIAGDK